MNLFPYLVLASGAVALVLFLVVRDNKSSVEAILLKTITSALFMLLAFTCMLANQDATLIGYYGLIIMGLLFGLIGDIVLDLKILYKDNIEQSDLYTHGGMGSFFIGHIFYLAAIIIYFSFSWVALLVAVAIAAFIVFLSLKVMKMNFGKFQFNVITYTLLLTYFVTNSFAAMIDVGGASAILLFIGATLFLLSDLVLSMTYFDGKDSKPLIIVNHVLYYSAQFLIALSILYMVA